MEDAQIRLMRLGRRAVFAWREPVPVIVRGSVGVLIVAALLSLVGLAAGSSHRVIELRPSSVDTCDEEFVRIANTLRPGDELVLRDGTYSQRCQRRIRNVHGAPGRPIVIRAAVGEHPVLTRPRSPDGDYLHNNLEIQDSSYLVLRGLTLRGGSTGLRFMGTTTHITVEDTEVYETTNNGITMNSGNTDSFLIRGNHIHHTGLLPDRLGQTEGEGLYLGCHDGSCVASNHVIERNYIHHLRGTSDGGNDGIEIKVGSHGISVRDNVLHRTNIGTRYPCIFVYGGGPQSNLVDGNVMWNCGEAIQVVSDAIIQNNIIANSDVGITAGPHEQVRRIRRVSIVNNTIFGHRVCLRIDWQGARDMMLANNAVYCPGGQAINASGLHRTEAVIRANLLEGDLAGAKLDGLRFLSGGRAREAFGNPAILDFWPQPSGPLVGHAIPELAPEADFNGRKRSEPYDVGAYQSGHDVANPGWRIASGFKGR